MTESEVPTLGLGPEQRQMWTQAVMTMAYGVRERRHALGRVAWSDEQTAERTHERTERIADPAAGAGSALRSVSTDGVNRIAAAMTTAATSTPASTPARPAPARPARGGRGGAAGGGSHGAPAGSGRAAGERAAGPAVHRPPRGPGRPRRTRSGALRGRRSRRCVEPVRRPRPCARRRAPRSRAEPAPGRVRSPPLPPAGATAPERPYRTGRRRGPRRPAGLRAAGPDRPRGRSRLPTARSPDCCRAGHRQRGWRPRPVGLHRRSGSGSGSRAAPAGRPPARQR